MGLFHRDTQRFPQRFAKIVRLSEVDAPQSDSAHETSTSLSLTKKTIKYSFENECLAPIEVEILLLFSLKSKRLKRIAGLAPKKFHAD